MDPANVAVEEYAGSIRLILKRESGAHSVQPGELGDKVILPQAEECGDGIDLANCQADLSRQPAVQRSHSWKIGMPRGVFPMQDP